MNPESGGNRRRQRDVAFPTVLRRGKDEPTVQELELPDDVNDLGVEVDVVDRQAERFSLTEAAAGAD